MGVGTLSTSSATVTALSVVGGLPFAVMSYMPFVGQPVSGAGVPAGATVASVVSATQFTLSATPTVAGPQTLTFGTEPVTTADAQLNAVIENPDDLPLVSAYITAARRVVETHLRSALITQTWILFLDSFPSAGGYYNRAIREIWPSLGGLPSGLGFYPGLVPNSTGVINIPLPPLQAINAVQYWDFQNVLQTCSSAAYNISIGTPARIQPQYSTVWPISRPTIDSVQITFTCGYGPLQSNVPMTTQVAMRYLVGTWYRNRESIAETNMMPVPHTFYDLLAADDPGIYA